MALYGGIDLHSNNNVTLLLDEQDRVTYQKRLPNACATILEQLAPYQEEIRGVVVESTYNWYWLVDGLMDAGYRVHLANPAAIQQYSGLKYTDDHSDARWLAHLLRLGVLPEGDIYPKPSVQCGIYCGSGAIWSSNGPPMCLAFRTSSSVTRAHG